MDVKTWTDGEIRKLARQTVDGRSTLHAARGEYLRALVGNTQAALNTDSEQTQLRALHNVHIHFQELVLEAIATDEILVQAGIAKKNLALERNRRMNFVRTQYGAIRGWLRVDGHDILKLDAEKVSKSVLLREAAPPRKHAMTPHRIKVRTRKFVGDLLAFTRQIDDKAQARQVIEDIMQQLRKQLPGAKETVKRRPLRGPASFPDRPAA